MVIGRLGPEYHTVDLTGCVPERGGTATLELGGENTKARPSLRARWLSGARPLWLRGRAHAAAGVGDEELRGVQARDECDQRETDARHSGRSDVQRSLTDADGSQPCHRVHEAAGEPAAMSRVLGRSVVRIGGVEGIRTPDPKTARRIRVFVIPARPPAARARIEEPSPDGTSAGR